MSITGIELVAWQKARIGYNITQLEIARNRVALKLIFLDQKQRRNKEPQRVMETMPKTSRARKEKNRSWYYTASEFSTEGNIWYTLY